MKTLGKQGESLTGNSFQNVDKVAEGMTASNFLELYVAKIV